MFMSGTFNRLISCFPLPVQRLNQTPTLASSFKVTTDSKRSSQLRYVSLSAWFCFKIVRKKISDGRFGTIYWSHLQGSRGPGGMSIPYYKSRMRNIPEKLRSDVHPGFSLKSRNTHRPCHYTGSSKKMDGIWNRYNVKKHWTDLHVWRLKMFRKV